MPEVKATLKDGTIIKQDSSKVKLNLTIDEVLEIKEEAAKYVAQEIFILLKAGRQRHEIIDFIVEKYNVK